MNEEFFREVDKTLDTIRTGVDQETIVPKRMDLLSYATIAIRHIRNRKKEELSEEDMDAYSRIIWYALVLGVEAKTGMDVEVLEELKEYLWSVQQDDSDKAVSEYVTELVRTDLEVIKNQ